jgi:hypothetical protein
MYSAVVAETIFGAGLADREPFLTAMAMPVREGCPLAP